MSPGGSANVEKDGRSQSGNSHPLPHLIRLFLSPPLPPSSSCFHQPGRRGQASGKSQGPPRTAARPSQASLASETAALPMGEGVFPEPSAGAAPPQVEGEITDDTTEPGFSQPEKAQFGDWLERQAAPPKWADLYRVSRWADACRVRPGGSSLPTPPTSHPRKGTAHVCFQGPSASSSDPTELLPTPSAQKSIFTKTLISSYIQVGTMDRKFPSWPIDVNLEIFHLPSFLSKHVLSTYCVLD